jgi:N6-L-threonylcarbamoyladenine synthase
MHSIVLGIETSCDETGVAIVESGAKILADVIASQEAIHAPYSGVVPELASRQHVMLLGRLYMEALSTAGLEQGDIDIIAVTKGPGLAGCLLAGLNFAKGLSYGLRLPIVGINHIEGHIHSCLLHGDVEYPAVALVVSGGHTMLVLVKEKARYELIGRTLDDAAGEAFDKVASMLGLGFPGGPAIERAAQGRKGTGNRRLMNFPRPLLNSGNYDFSFSGLKTAVLYWLKRHRHGAIDDSTASEVAFEFQRAAVEVLAAKTVSAAEKTGAGTILLAGGVAQNEPLRSELEASSLKKGIRVIYPAKRYCGDNAVMIAALGYQKYQAGQRDGWDMDIVPGLRLC